MATRLLQVIGARSAQFFIGQFSGCVPFLEIAGLPVRRSLGVVPRWGMSPGRSLATLESPDTGLRTDYNNKVLMSSLCSDDERTQMRLIQAEYSAHTLHPDGQILPENVTDEMWLHLLKECSTPVERKNKLRLWGLKEHYRRKRLEQKKEKALRKEEDARNGGLKGSGHILSVNIKESADRKLTRAMQHGQHLVFDMGYEEHMSLKDSRRLMRQLHLCHGFNKNATDPFHYVFCNINNSDFVVKTFKKDFNKEQFELHRMYTTTEMSYLDLYPKERLVYLTPNARESLRYFSHQDVYIIGAFVDMTDHKPRSLAKAKKEGLRMARLPLESYLRWGPGAAKSLTLDQMTQILLDVKDTNCWKHAFRHVPVRKLKE